MLLRGWQKGRKRSRPATPLAVPPGPRGCSEKRPDPGIGRGAYDLEDVHLSRDEDPSEGVRRGIAGRRRRWWPILGARRGCRWRSGSAARVQVATPPERARVLVAMLAFARRVQVAIPERGAGAGGDARVRWAGAGGDSDRDAAAFSTPEGVSGDRCADVFRPRLTRYTRQCSRRNRPTRINGSHTKRHERRCSSGQTLAQDANRRALRSRTRRGSAFERPPVDPSRPMIFGGSDVYSASDGAFRVSAQRFPDTPSDVICAAASQAESRPEPAPRTFGSPPVQRASPPSSAT